MIWAALGALTLLVLALLLRPLVFFRRERVSASEGQLAIYRDQLKEVEREAADGLLAQSEAATVRLEIERRMLAAARDEAAPGVPPKSRRVALAVPLVLLLFAGPLALYLAIGQPLLPDRPFAERDPAGEMPDIGTALAKLKAHLAEQPGDIQGWELLGRTELNVGEPEQAAEAYAQALQHGGDLPAEKRAELNSAAGEAQVQAAGGTVSDAAKRSFEATLALTPDDPRARFYLAVGREQSGDREGALSDYLAIIRASPPDAPWQNTVRQKALQMAAALGKDPASLGLDASAAALPPNAAEIAGKSPEEQQQMIRGMVAGLAEKLKNAPDDVEGWIRLGRSYTVLGERDKAREALAEAAKRAPERADVLIAYAHTLYAPEDAQQAAPPPEFIALMRRVLTLEPAAPEALWFVANDEAQAGHGREAREMFDKLLAQMPPDAPARAAVQSRIDSLRAGPRRAPGG